MNILNVAFPFSNVNAHTAGGAEQILLSIDEALTKSGFNSYVIAASGSYVSGKLIASRQADSTIINNCVKVKYWSEYKMLIESTIKETAVDLIHFHGFDFHEYVCNSSIPILVTLHLPLNHYNKSTFKNNYFFTFVSQYQALHCKHIINNVSIIENGVSIPETFISPQKKDLAISMGRICPEKGFHLSLKASRKVNIPFFLAGTVYPYEEHINYFKNEILPNLDNIRYRYIGCIGPDQKRKLVSSAKCLLIPSLIDETSSLVAMEALSFGTPVIAFKSGALNDIIKNGINGFLVDNEDEMADAILQIDSIDTSVCHQIAAQKYDKKRMTSEYFELYKNIIT